MTSSYTPLGVELMVTGENAGTWGTKTNTNLNIIEQISGGYISQAIAGSGTTAFTKTDGGTGSVVATRVIEFTGALTGSRIITFPVLTENFYLIKNTTTNAETLQLKAATGSGATVTWATDDKGWKLVYFDGVSTNTGVYDVGFGAATSPGGSTTQVQFNNSGAFGGDADLIWTAGTALTINSQKELRLADTDDSAYVGVRSHATVTGSYTLTMPAATGSADQILVTDGSGNLSFVDNSGGTAWQAVSAAASVAVAAGNGYFLKHYMQMLITATLPASPNVR